MAEIDIRMHPSPQSRELEISGLLFYRRFKRLVDFILAIFFLLLFSPLMLLIGVGVRASSRGPVFYRQERIGKDGRLFYMFKFRTMRNGNNSHVHVEHVQRLIREDTRPDAPGHHSLKLANDARITPFGKLLRKLSLDELPQFINVLLGEMSIVGPRPPLPYEYVLYDGWHKQRLYVLPGITGLWQVTGHNQVSFSEMVQMDLDYIEQMSPWLDFKIMLLTPMEMLRGKGGG